MTQTATKERGLICTAAQVRAIQNGATQFRRVMEPQPEFVQNGYEGDGYRTGAPSVPCYAWPPTAPFWRPMSEHAKSCPYGAPGDRLWVQEEFSRNHSMHYSHKSSRNVCGILYRASWDGDTDYYDRPFTGQTAWLDPQEMPRDLSRITLEVKRRWVEPVQKISEEDAIAEGAEPNWCGPLDGWDPEKHGYYSQCPCGEASCECTNGHSTAREWFQELWDSINAKTYPWASNPWVWCVEFERVGEKR